MSPSIRKLSFAVTLVIVATVPSLADNKADCGNKQLEAGKRIAACSNVVKSATTNQARAEAYKERGYAYLDEGDRDRAISDLTEAIRLAPKTFESYMFRGVAYTFIDDFDRAILDFSAAIKSVPGEVPGWIFRRRGSAYAGKQDYDRAIADYSEAIRRDPKDVDSFSARGIAYGFKNERDKAIADYSQAISLDPKNGDAFRNRGVMHHNKGELDRAAADYSEAIRLNKDDFNAYDARSNSFLAKGDVARAVADYEQVVRIKPDDDNAKKRLNELRQQAAAKTAAPVIAAVTPPLPPAPVLQTMPPRATTDRRVALVIGNAAYRSVPALANPMRDAQTIADALRSTGFQTVTLQSDLGREALVTALRDFAQIAEKADWAVVYYAGHGIEVGGVNYLVPIDAKLNSDRDVGFEAVALDQVINAAERAGKLRLIVLDACRDNPFASQMKRSLTVASRSVSRGLAQVEPDAGTLVVYAAKHGETALDGDGGNSPFAAAFVKNMQTPGVEVRRLFDNVRDDVLETTKRRQQPFSYGSISGRQDFYFVAGR